MSKKLFVAAIAGSIVAAAYMFSWVLSQPKFNEPLQEDVLALIDIAPLDQALTLAVSDTLGALLVTEASAAGVKAIPLIDAGVDMSADAVDAFLALGRDSLRALADSDQARHFAWEDLSVPVKANAKHIAAGTNYTAHAEEVGHEGEPFLFPKLSYATPWNADVKTGVRLDHEVELCAVPLQDYSAGAQAVLGYFLCGDFTDRWTLVKDIDLDGDMGKTGFPAAKGGDTRFPTGALLVIPADSDFYQRFDLNLYVNTELRQHASADRMVWDPATIMNKALADCREPYQKRQETLTLIDGCSKIPAKTIVLTGTPEGVMFHMGTLWNSAFYLQKGDVVTAYSRYLGVTRNTIN